MTQSNPEVYDGDTSNSSQEGRRDDLSGEVLSLVGLDLDPYRDALKRNLDRLHMMMSQMMTVRGHQSLLMDHISGRIKMSRPMEKMIICHLNRMLARSKNLVKGRKKRKKKRKRVKKVSSTVVRDNARR